MPDVSRETLLETGLVASGAQSTTAPRRYLVQVTSGASSGVKAALGARKIVIGADPECDLVLDDPKVSGRHLTLLASPAGIELEDLGSTNGTFVEEARVERASLPSSCLVRAGDTNIKVSPAPSVQVTPSSRTSFGALVGESISMREAFAILELAAPTEATVLIQGESGTGKELAARALHDGSARGAGPFVVFDCAAASDHLIESQLFGHREGAFTGAIADRRGAFVEADGGTLFIDEIGELELSLQAKLLRAIEQRSVQPLGTDAPVQVDVRVVAATHRDLKAMVDEGSFRFDLFYRLAVVHLYMPPLRERLDDLPCLIRNFYVGRNVEAGPIEGENLDRLRSHRWPANVRELRNVLERGWVLSGIRNPKFLDLELWLESDGRVPGEVIDTTLPFKEAKERCVQAFERRYLAEIFRRFEGNISRAAEASGINRRHFRKLIDEYGLRDE